MIVSPLLLKLASNLSPHFTQLCALSVAVKRLDNSLQAGRHFCWIVSLPRFWKTRHEMAMQLAARHELQEAQQCVSWGVTSGRWTGRERPDKN